jgi:uncharacterized repeat protein (TIGR03803 family)
MRRIAGFLLFALTCALLPAAGVAQTEAVLYDFCAKASCADGSAPNQGVIQASDGNYYGTTTTGGAYGYGTIFRLTPSGTLTTLYSFCAQTSCDDGATPSTPLVEAPDGSLYGGTQAGGNGLNSPEHCDQGCGVLYRITLAGDYSVVYSFCQLAGCGDGIAPAQIMFGPDGNIYGAASEGGPPYTVCINGCGEIFKMTTAGVWSAVYGFQGGTTDGIMPTGIVLGLDGDLYGTAQGGGLYEKGSIFKLPFGIDESLTILHSFCSAGGNCVADGSTPSALVQAEDGNFYGGTAGGGASNKGTLFKVTTTGTLTNLYSFCSTTGCGASLSNALFPAPDGNLYGTTTTGGDTSSTDCTTGCGVLFELTSAEAYSAIRSFNPATNDAVNPAGPLMMASNGDFYGTGSAGGTAAECATSGGCGAVYGVAPAAAIAAPVQVTLSPTSVASGSPSTLSWKSLNAFSDTMQQCYLYSILSGTQTALGKLTGGTYNSTTHVFSGTTTVTPSGAGSYTYAVTCGGSESGSAVLTSTGSKNTTTTALTYSPTPLSVGQTVSLKATVSHASGSATPTGTVTFSVGSTVLATETVSSGVATLTAPTSAYAPGAYPIVATYSGDTNYTGSASAATTVTLNKAATTTTMTASPNPVTPPANCTLTATVKRSASGAAGYATGSVTFSVDGTALATINLNGSGVATLGASTSSVPAGAYPVVATYNGDSSDNGSASSADTVTVK